ncbi:antibiotic biosynthesis monooxygenase [Nocardia mexicana]|uniref:Antibiotic biosynthesis monooxygenase n=1 Tax=Nocardia mexicana TaxID=279262 RepID=A0A370H7Q1_9NOCA|nr:antibiotic biosynthesis monooxygenase [Nocardia mexicana]RDI52681.1 antibiotic biosynthesis monooxygenase [Nocardia mexicana]
MSSEYLFGQWPAPDRTDAGAVLINVWRGATPERMRRFTDDMVDGVWPAELTDGELSFSLYESEDGRSLMAYKQWTSKDAYDAYLAVRGFGGAHAFREANPDVEFHHDWFRLLRSGVRPGETRTPGCMVLVDIEPETAESGKRWVDQVFDAFGSDGAGSQNISAHFHRNLDGTALVNYAEWESAAAHEQALAEGNLSTRTTEQWERVRQFGGVTFRGFTRYRLLRSIQRPAPAAEH